MRRGDEGAEVLRPDFGWKARAEAGIAALSADHVRLRALCDRLEGLADRLPALPAAEERGRIARQLATLVPCHQAMERAVLDDLFPEAREDPLGHALLDRIASQHALDELHAQDLGAVLDAADASGPPGGAAALGYMLRCFFDGCRRALAFEELSLITLARHRLPPDATRLLAACLSPGPARLGAGRPEPGGAGPAA
ncbi:hemerythrin domain-containing protein [Roseomonas sp. OT10]|uniref:hemerythrin domain-containing protein n=1 Tax=Roseomonas cutis TaxID=2897332 RepID=UPI001E37BF1E|nr:hemerythrin domain-containing protein [Roseomonas sp. OT10]UFN49965.1 hemerythrin domain-containing protein [Roseomonas sp. OT10]